MITVWKLGKKENKMVGKYEGSTNNMKDIFKALDRARKVCPTGKLVVGGVTAPDRKKKEPEIK